MLGLGRLVRRQSAERLVVHRRIDR
jgi:hypothetical protein